MYSKKMAQFFPEYLRTGNQCISLGKFAQYAQCLVIALVIPHIFDHMDMPRTMSSSRRIPFQITSFPGGLSFFLAR